MCPSLWIKSVQQKEHSRRFLKCSRITDVLAVVFSTVNASIPEVKWHFRMSKKYTKCTKTTTKASVCDSISYTASLKMASLKMLTTGKLYDSKTVKRFTLSVLNSVFIPNRI